MMTTEERLERLEKEVRRGKRLAGVLGVLFVCLGAWAVCAGGWMGAKPAVVGEVRARGFALVDEKGMLRAGLSVVKGEPGLSLWDENERVIWKAP